MQGAALAQGDELLRVGAEGLGLGQGGANPAVLDERAGEIHEQRVAVILLALKFDDFSSVFHVLNLSKCLL